MNQPSPSRESTESRLVLDPIDQSSWLLTTLLWSAAWLTLAFLFSLLASIKFHGPGFLADTPWLTYGRLRPAHIHCLYYGFCLQAGLAVTAWIFGRLGRVTLAQPLLARLATCTFNLGVALGVFGILRGDASGYEFLEFPRYAAVILFVGYLLLGVLLGLTFHRRMAPDLYVSHWYLLAALFWFPWTFSSAALLLLVFPVRGMAQPVIAWWFAENFQMVWMWLVGLGGIFYFIPKLTDRPLHSRHLALFAFWSILLFASWGGIPASASVPSWLPSLSTAATLLSSFVLITVFVNLHRTMSGRYDRLWSDPTLRFIAVGGAMLLLVGMARIATAHPSVAAIVDFTWFRYALTQLNAFGFLGMVLLGGAYYAAARLPGLVISLRLARIHFWLSLSGVVVGFVPLLIGGLIQGLKLHNPEVAFLDVVSLALHFLRLSTIGELLLLAGSGLFLINLSSARFRRARERFTVARLEATRDLFATAEAHR